MKCQCNKNALGWSLSIFGVVFRLRLPGQVDLHIGIAFYNSETNLQCSAASTLVFKLYLSFFAVSELIPLPHVILIQTMKACKSGCRCRNGKYCGFCLSNHLGCSKLLPTQHSLFSDLWIDPRSESGKGQGLFHARQTSTQLGHEKRKGLHLQPGCISVLIKQVTLIFKVSNSRPRGSLSYMVICHLFSLTAKPTWSLNQWQMRQDFLKSSWRASLEALSWTLLF